MNTLKNKNEYGDLVTIEQMSGIANLGSYTIRRLATEAGAVRKIGRNYRINRKVFLDYIESVYS